MPDVSPPNKQAPVPSAAPTESSGQRVGQLHLAGLGTAVPAHGIAQADAAVVAGNLVNFTDEERQRVEKLYSLTRVGRRHSVLLKSGASGEIYQDFFPASNGTQDASPPLSERMVRYESCAPDLALAAARKALDDAKVERQSISHVITVSCSGFTAPGVDTALIKALELTPTTERTHVGFMGCHGALNGIRVARGYASVQPDARILLVAVELCSLHYQYSRDDETNLANGLFSDGAAAAVFTADVPATTPAWRCAATGSCILPDSEAAMTWRIRDHGFQMTLSREVPIKIKAHLRPWLTDWLSSHGYALDDIQSWAVHPGGPAILQGVRDALSLSRRDLAVSWDILRDYGNMSSPTVLFVLEALRRQQAPRPCVAMGFGPGLAVEAQLWL